MSAASSARRLFAARGLRAKKAFGQCFLADPNVARILAGQASAPGGATALEIGAGTGALTTVLLELGFQVIAIERDRDLVPLLHQAFGDAIRQCRLTVLEEDAVRGDWTAWLTGTPLPHVVVGNLPYQITGRLLRKTVATADQIDRAVFLVQKEVGDRLVAPVGTKQYGALTVFVRSAFEARIRMVVPSSCFRPKPSVDSCVVVLQPRTKSGGVGSPAFETLVRAAFAKRRKTLRNAWAGLGGLSGADLEKGAVRARIDLNARGETLAVDDFVRMAEAVVDSARRG